MLKLKPDLNFFFTTKMEYKRAILKKFVKHYNKS